MLCNRLHALSAHRSVFFSVFLSLVIFAACSEKQRTTYLPVLDTVLLDSTYLKVEVIADSLVVPWDLEIDSEGGLWFTEQEGWVSRINPENGVQKLMLQIPEVWKVRTSGLLGMVSHPEFSQNPFVFLNYTAKTDTVITSRLVRYTYSSDTLTDPVLLLEIPGGRSHNGSRLAFGPDRKIYWATGDAHDTTFAQNPDVPNGKILRLNPDGSIPSDNPDPASPVWALGFRNMQGLVFSDRGTLYTSEHGDAIEDEVNLIQKGGNYGWPTIEGVHDLQEERLFADRFQCIEPLRSWTPVIAPAGMAYYGMSVIPEWENALLLTTLKGKSLRILPLSPDGNEVMGEFVLFENHYGRLRDVAVARDGTVYLATSNQDWNPQPGFPLPGDDKILKISLTDFDGRVTLRHRSVSQSLPRDGQQLYQSFCASCHKDDGSGVEGTFPALNRSDLVNGDDSELIRIMLEGQAGSGQGISMPSFSFLTDEEIASVLTYVRGAWDNRASPVTTEQIGRQ